MCVLYQAQVMSLLKYGIGVWGNNRLQKDFETRQRLQNKCFSILMNCTGLLKLSHIVTLENCKLGHGLRYRYLPINLLECVLTDSEGYSLTKKHKYGTRNKKIPNTPMS